MSLDCCMRSPYCCWLSFGVSRAKQHCTYKFSAQSRLSSFIPLYPLFFTRQFKRDQKIYRSSVIFFLIWSPKKYIGHLWFFFFFFLASTLGREDPLEKKVPTHSSILAWKIPWTEVPGGLQSVGLQRVRHDWSDLACVAIITFPIRLERSLTYN